MAGINYWLNWQPGGTQTTHIASGKPVIEAADEHDVAQEQLSHLVEIHRIHTKFCRCLDCQVLQSVTGELLRRFRPTQRR